MLIEQGRRLAKGTSRYGEELEDSEASLIHVQRAGAATARVRVADAVGMVSIPTLQVVVRPKIPYDHFVRILEEASVLPRFAGEVGYLGAEPNLAVLVSHWFVAAAERVIEEGLARDYRLHRDEILTVRGRLDVVATARILNRGRIAVAAEFEEYDFDTSLNRLVLEAARIVTAGGDLPDALRRRALRVAKRMDGVGDFRTADLDASVDRRTAYYADAAGLARQLVTASGRMLDAGKRKSWSFLMRTPDMIEAGIRAVITRGVEDSDVAKRSIALGGTTMTVNPDLVVNHDQAVADIKYKLGEPGWRRSDLYEVVAFAAALRTVTAALINFREQAASSLQPVEVGDITVSELSWRVHAGISPDEAAEALVSDFKKWIAPPADPC